MTMTGVLAAVIARLHAPIGHAASILPNQKSPKEQINPDMAYLGNRIRPKGTMEKCTFCLGRTRNGLLPKCAEACPTGSRQFGNLLDPDSVIRHILREKRVYVFKEDMGTRPKFYYWFDK